MRGYTKVFCRKEHRAGAMQGKEDIEISLSLSSSLSSDSLRFLHPVASLLFDQLDCVNFGIPGCMYTTEAVYVHSI